MPKNWNLEIPKVKCLYRHCLPPLCRESPEIITFSNHPASGAWEGGGGGGGWFNVQWQEEQLNGPDGREEFHISLFGSPFKRRVFHACMLWMGIHSSASLQSWGMIIESLYNSGIRIVWGALNVHSSNYENKDFNKNNLGGIVEWAANIGISNMWLCKLKFLY